jgi:peptidyl-prolyl cis-trans isomerase A (cyclophilin A)
MNLLRRSFLAAVSAFTATRAFAQVPAGAAPAAAPATEAAPAATEPPAPANLLGKIVKVKLTTELGDIIIDLYPDRAPITVANWLRYVDNKRYDNSTFYRASHPANTTDYGVIQGGLENNPAKVFPPIKLEPTSKTGLKHLDGSISMGRLAPNSATSDYFICIGDSPYLDSDPTKPGDNAGYATFGRVVEGMDVVKKILVSPVSPTLGTGAMKGQMLSPRIKLMTARRAPS